VYLGPVNAATFASDGTTHRTSVSAPCRADIAHRASILQLNGYPSSGDQIRWHVWSRAGAAVKAVVNGWIDDRYDYQRRREDQGLVRTTW
jgi:hypothetical protein